MVRSGREVRGYLHHPRAWPLRAVAPVRILPCVAPVPDAAAAAAGSAAVGSARKGEQPEACRARERAPLTPSTRVWVFVHRAAVAEAREALENAISIINSEIQKEIREEMMANHENQSVAESVAESMVDERLVDIAPEQPQVCRFQLRGPQSHAVLVRALQLARGGDARPPGDAPPFGDAPPPGVETPPCGDAPSTPTSIPGVENAKAWSSLCHLASPAPLPPNALLALRVTHPRTAPTPRPPPGASDAESSSAAPSGPSGHSPSTSPRLTAQLSQLLHQWPSSLGASALFSESSGSFSETCPFASDPPLPLAASSYPLLLVQEPPVAGGAGGGAGGGVGLAHAEAVLGVAGMCSCLLLWQAPSGTRSSWREHERLATVSFDCSLSTPRATSSPTTTRIRSVVSSESSTTPASVCVRTWRGRPPADQTSERCASRTPSLLGTPGCSEKGSSHRQPKQLIHYRPPKQLIHSRLTSKRKPTRCLRIGRERECRRMQERHRRMQERRAHRSCQSVANHSPAFRCIRSACCAGLGLLRRSRERRERARRRARGRRCHEQSKASSSTASSESSSASLGREARGRQR